MAEERVPLVSIVIPVYRGANYMREAIDSALGQSWPRCEVIVVNDGSPDGGETERIALSYGDRIRYIAKENGGVSTALNEGIRQMKGEYFSWLSHDDLYLPDKIAHQMACLQGCDTSKTIVFGDYANFTDEAMVEENVVGKRYTKEELERPLFAVFHRAVYGCTPLIPRSLFDRYGLFDEKQRTTQDYDMWFRLMRYAPVRYCPACDTKARIHAAQVGRTISGQYQAECERLWRSLIDQVTPEEMCAMAGSEEAFYTEVGREFRDETAYPKAAALLLTRGETAQMRRRLAEAGLPEGLKGSIARNAVTLCNMKAEHCQQVQREGGNMLTFAGGVSGEIDETQGAALIAALTTCGVGVRLNAAEDHPLMRRALDNRLPVIACVGRELAAAMRADVCRTWDEWDDLRECQCVVTEEQETATILLGVSDCVCVVPEQEQAAWAAGVLRQDEDMQRAAMLRRQVTPVPLLKQLGQEVRHRARQMEDAQASAAWGASRVKELEEERRQMRASSSWRVTAPLRMASAGLQRLRKGAQTSRRK